MAYYPKSQIKTNQYTDGSEYNTPNGNSYQGFYYKVSTGKLYTGKSPQDSPNLLLTLQRTLLSDDEFIGVTQNTQISQAVPAMDGGDPDPQIPERYRSTAYLYGEYVSRNEGPPKSLTIPYFNPNTPTDKDYTIGEFRRYFCKRVNNIIYIEINKQQYDSLINRDINWYWAMYIPFYTPWNISGDINQVETTNRNIIKLTSFREKLPKLGAYLKDNYLKYYK